MVKNLIQKLFKSKIIKGTIILTAAGFVSRIIGFFFRIFLTKVIGAEGLGIFQLIFPVQVICYAFCTVGFELSISKFVSAYKKNNPSKCQAYLSGGLYLSGIISVIVAIVVFFDAEYIAARLLMEKRCTELIKIMSFSILPASVHSCICGYYLGYKASKIPATAQIIEQITRVVLTYILILLLKNNEVQITPGIVVIGTVLGELGSSSFCIYNYKKRKGKLFDKSGLNGRIYKDIIKMSAPLTLNKLMLSILQSIQSVLIPTSLIAYGLSSKEALSIYGIILGLVLPLVVFPSAIVNSMSLLLLPSVSEAKSSGNENLIRISVKKTTYFCLIFGIICTTIFVNFGEIISNLMFGADYSFFIKAISLVCPFMFINSAMSSVLNGIGKTGLTFMHNVIMALMQIFAIVILVPKVGIAGYILGLIISSAVTAISYGISVYIHIFIAHKESADIHNN